jgi:hypothetical protein
MTFLFGVVNSGDVDEVKFASVHILCQLMSIISSDSLSDIGSLFYEVEEEDIMVIYRFLEREYGLPKVEPNPEDRDL